MSADMSQAISAYQNAIRDLGREAASGPVASQQSGGPSFAEFLGDSLNEAVSSGREAEQIGVRAMAGQADLTELVTAVTNAELTLQTVVGVRDKVLQAYQEILRMPI